MITYLQRKYITIFSVSLLYSCNILCMQSILPLSIGKYQIKSPHERYTILTDLKNTCPDGIVQVLNQIMQPHYLDKTVIGDIRGIYMDLGMHQSLFFMQLIGKLTHKTKENSDTLVTFINQQRKIYHCKDKNGNIDKTGNFLKAFDDAKKLFYFLPIIQNKYKNNQSLTENEYNYLIKNMYLIEWLPKNSTLIVSNSFLNRFKTFTSGMYRHNPAAFYMYVGICSSPLLFSSLLRAICHMPIDYTFPVLLLMGNLLNNSVIVTFVVTNTTPNVIQITSPVNQQDNETVSIEDMGTIIENTPWLDE